MQGAREGALLRLAGEPVLTTVAGRTDAGVHALRQVVSCEVPDAARLLADLDRARGALDALVGDAITVWSVAVAAEGFDARFSARLRRYRYRLCDAPAIDPLERHRTWHAGPPALDVPAMAAGAAHLLGEHDFASFCRRAGDQRLVRRIDRLDVARADVALVTVEVDGPAFCHQMVRSVVGCLVAVGRGRRRPRDVAAVLAARDRAAAPAIAPAHGLTLVGVEY